MKKFALFLTGLISALSAFASSVIMEGTYIGDTRYDANKIWDNDYMLCWAAASSNAIKYWQNSYMEHGYEMPSGIPMGTPTAAYNSDIFEIFVNNWSDKGGFNENGLQWWFDGDIPVISEGSSELNPGSTAGRYWADLPFVQEYDVFLTLPQGQYFSEQDELKDVLDELIMNDFPITASIYKMNGGGHAITIWGYEYDDTLETISGFWISDSDDNYLGNLLVDVFWDDTDSMWHLADYYNTNDWFLGSLTSLIIPVPEPSAYAAIFGAAVLALALFRKRK